MNYNYLKHWQPWDFPTEVKTLVMNTRPCVYLRECKAVSLICCGDFNSVPECGIYQLFTSNTVLPDYKDWTSKPEEEVKGLSLSQPFSMQSACGIPDYTNYTVSFAACLDYIYYQTDRFTVEAMVPLPSDDVLREHRAIPSVVFPSDHVALIADLKWSKN